MNKLQLAFCATLLAFGVSHAASALTLKSGQVLSSDGQVYDGASPEQKEALIAKSKEKGWFGADGKKSGVQGSNVFIVVQDGVVFVPITEIKGKSKEGVTEVIKNHIVDTLMADITAKHIAEEGMIDAEHMEKFAELANSELVNNAVTAEIAEQIAEDAASNAAMAEALTEATLAVATVDINNAAEVAAAEASYEATIEAAHAEKCAGGPGSAEGC